jgi:hypothetical protein
LYETSLGIERDNAVGSVKHTMTTQLQVTQAAIDAAVERAVAKRTQDLELRLREAEKRLAVAEARLAKVEQRRYPDDCFEGDLPGDRRGQLQFPVYPATPSVPVRQIPRNAAPNTVYAL